MKLRRVIRKRVDHHTDGIDVVAGVNGVVAANVGQEGPSVTTVHSSERVVQRSGRAGRRSTRRTEEKA